MEDGEPGELLWHYARMERFIGIVERGAIVPCNLFVGDFERPAVWFSPALPWEPSCGARALLSDGTVGRLGMAESARRGGGLVRIGVAPGAAPLSWEGWVRTSGVAAFVANTLAATGRALGSDPARWRATYAQVPRDQWGAVEVWDGSCWVRVPFERELPAAASA
jgi:hypothetical protein